MCIYLYFVFSATRFLFVFMPPRKSKQYVARRRCPNRPKPYKAERTRIITSNYILAQFEKSKYYNKLPKGITFRRSKIMVYYGEDFDFEYLLPQCHPNHKPMWLNSSFRREEFEWCRILEAFNWCHKLPLQPLKLNFDDISNPISSACTTIQLEQSNIIFDDLEKTNDGEDDWEIPGTPEEEQEIPRSPDPNGDGSGAGKIGKKRMKLRTISQFLPRDKVCLTTRFSVCSTVVLLRG